MASMTLWPPPLNCSWLVPAGTPVMRKAPPEPALVIVPMLCTPTRVFCAVPVMEPWMTPLPFEGISVMPQAVASRANAIALSDLMGIFIGSSVRIRPRSRGRGGRAPRKPPGHRVSSQHGQGVNASDRVLYSCESADCQTAGRADPDDVKC